jgi:hypothetical protein
MEKRSPIEHTECCGRTFDFILDSVWIQFEFNLDRIIRTVFVPEVVIVQVPAQGRSEAILGVGQIRRICEDIAPR